MRLLENKTDEEEYTKFLENHERCNFQQSLEWARVKTSWKREVILAEDNNKKIIGSLMVWIRKIPIFGNIMYSARGPICDIHDMEVLQQLAEGAKILAKKYNAIVLRIEPDIKSNDEEFSASTVSGGPISCTRRSSVCTDWLMRTPPPSVAHAPRHPLSR